MYKPAPKPLRISFPFKPFVVTQQWGNSNPAYSAQFNDPNFKCHNGVDANVGRAGDIAYQTTFPVYCPVEGFHVEGISYEANGGGNQISLVSDDPVLVGDKVCHARIFLCHAKKILVKENAPLQRGQVLMIADNTGFSTGPHTHIGLYRIDAQGRKLDQNDATGSYNPALCYSWEYAIEQAGLPLLISNAVRLARYYLTGL
jgi:murein DD-endopeptidase MepM/ murein hydrolase activator NlpD